MKKQKQRQKLTAYGLRLTAERGFSLVEVLVGTTVLVIAVTGTLSIIARNVSSAAIAEERVTAFYLAQEALEYVRGVRDNNAIASPRRGWLDGLNGIDGPNCQNDKCVIDVNASPGDPIGTSGNPNAEACSLPPGGVCPPLYLDISSGLYNQRGNGVETIFTREVDIENITLNEEVRVNATVRWPQGFVERSFTISGHLFNWR